MTIVIDASVALTWVYRDEASDDTDAIFLRVAKDGAFVPAHFHLEVANSLLQGEKRSRMTPAYSAERLAVLQNLRLDVDVSPDRAWTDTVALGRIERLTAYDASYLELALRLGADIATLDSALAAAARRRGLTVVPRNPP